MVQLWALACAAPCIWLARCMANPMSCLLANPQLSVNPPLVSSLSRHHLNYYTPLLLTLLAFDHLFTGWTDSLRYELQASNWIESQACTFPCNLALINAHLLLTLINWA